jgi:hypothetical protein
MVRKWQGYPTTTSQEAADFRYRKARADIVVIIANGDDERAKTITLGQQFEPSRVMKDIGLGL